MNQHLAALLLAIALSPCVFSQSDFRLPNPIFIYELGDRTPDEQAELVKNYSFDGTVFDGAKLVPERLRATSDRGLHLFFLWLTADVSDGRITYETGMDEAIHELKGRDTAVWLAIKGDGAGGEERAIQAVRHVSELAARENLRVALYPHYGFYLARFADVVRVAEAARCSNVGVTFNLCHELRAGLDPDIKPLLQRSLPRLYAVTINGADRNGKDWNTLIQPLGHGDFDVTSLVRTFLDIGYRGPFGIQCYGIHEDPRSLLPESLKAWQKIVAEVAPRS